MIFWRGSLYSRSHVRSTGTFENFSTAAAATVAKYSTFITHKVLLVSQVLVLIVRALLNKILATWPPFNKLKSVCKSLGELHENIYQNYRHKSEYKSVHKMHECLWPGTSNVLFAKSRASWKVWKLFSPKMAQDISVWYWVLRYSFRVGQLQAWYFYKFWIFSDTIMNHLKAIYLQNSIFHWKLISLA